MGRAIGILDLLRIQGFDINQRFKYVRHKESRFQLEEFEPSWLQVYQSFQHKPVFDGADCILTFLGIRSTLAKFLGIYSVAGRRPGNLGDLPKGFPEEGKGWLAPEYCYYELEKLTGFEELEGRAIIDWGKNVRGWHQWGRPGVDKEVAELLPKGNIGKPFDDYLNFSLTHAQLRKLRNNPEANTDWIGRLTAVAGIYLILAKPSGRLYVGSAHGPKGIWGRWSAYAVNGHGDNKLLKKLIADDSSYPEQFLYSILQIVPSSTVHSVLLSLERRYKEKLGTLAIMLSEGELSGGLNAN